MKERAYINPDGSVKAEIIAEQQASLAMSAQRHNVDPKLVDALMEEVNKHGYVIIPNLVSRELMNNIKAEITPLLTHDGRNEFEGHKTRRIYSVIEKTLALLDRVLLPNYLLSQLQAINILPGETSQPLHCDDGFYPIPRPRKPFSAATIWAIDDFTADNGATVAIPDSHLWGDEHPGDGSGFNLVSAVMPAGSVLFFLGTLWHGGGANHSNGARMAATAQYCEPWARQQENYSLAISRERAKLCSEKIQKMLGYSMFFPFIGFVNGRDPIRLLKD
ncbi:MAG: phytanoyl-CoA dioxygenase family protein [Pseudomonadales bacterium]|jgi:ectoine hydroxylase-related dioxygenase (phytanoyl-CoA dioxygenase family)|nr:phytanoyl-CoA dioxygenase family protein [Pseudomonadales bacterium]